MKKIFAALVVTSALTMPAVAYAKPVTFTVDMNRYGGDGAYLAFYVTDASGAYAGSLWMAGEKSKYYKHLSGWYRASAGNTAEVDGITGASVGQGKTLAIELDLQDALFDAGYTLHVDASVEDMQDSPREVSIPLTTDGAGQPAAGTVYINSVTYGF